MRHGLFILQSQAVSMRNMMLKQKRLILCGTVLSLGMIGYGVTVGNEPPKVPEKQSSSAKEADVKKAKAASDQKPSVYANAKPATKDTEKKSEEQPTSADEKAIRATGETYVKAYCDADANSIAALFTSDAEYIDEGGNVHQGREAIEKSMKAVFDENPGAKIEVDIQTIRIVSPGVAIEDGSTVFTSCQDQWKMAGCERPRTCSQRSAATSDTTPAARLVAGRLG